MANVSLAVAKAMRESVLDQSSALGNSDRTLGSVAQDLCNQVRGDKKAMQHMVDNCYLGKQTIQRVMDEGGEGESYRPQADTLERIIRYWGASVNFSQVIIKNKYRNKEKT